MMNPRKSKKKKSQKLTSIAEENQRDWEQIATENLFNVSNFDDDAHNTTLLNQELNLFKSLNMQTNTQKQAQNTRNVIRFSQNKTNHKKSLQLENYMDHQFMQKSKFQLNLYSTMPQKTKKQQYVARSKERKRQIRGQLQNKKYKSEQQKNIQSQSQYGSFKSDSVFVAKISFMKENSIQKHKRNIRNVLSPQDKRKQEKGIKQNEHTRVGVSLLTSHENNFASRHERNLGKRSLSPYYVSSKINFFDYDRIKRLKTFNSIDFKEMLSKKLTGENFSVKIIKEDNHSDNDKIATFRRRDTFYKSHKHKFLSKINASIIP